MENQDFLFNDIDVKKYKMSEADIIPYYLYFNLYKNCLAKDIRHRHYKVNNDFVRKYVLSSGAGVSESLWCSPSSFNDSGVLLIGDMPVADGDPNGTVTVRLLDSSEEQYFYICLIYSSLPIQPSECYTLLAHCESQSDDPQHISWEHDHSLRWSVEYT